jgi:hypothetical protein
MVLGEEEEPLLEKCLVHHEWLAPLRCTCLGSEGAKLALLLPPPLLHLLQFLVKM